MERQRTARRSASHGTLNGTYADQDFESRSNPAVQRLNSLQGSAKHNNSVFAGPGPLESMLKKTTETSDIGIFSIRTPTTSSVIPLQRPLWNRTNCRDPMTRGSISSSLSTVIAGQDDRRRLPSFRDNASEITSMQESDSHASAASSLQLPYDDGGYRSYSMTSCSSRAPPRQRSDATLLSQASSSALQRPRSPFPYPTRLKRLGVRPASPALTMDGGVDYSRRVALDRISYRTVHGSHRPANPSLQRRPLRRARQVRMSETSSAICPPRKHTLRPPYGPLNTESMGPFSRDYTRGSLTHGRRASTFTSATETHRRRFSNTTYNEEPPAKTALYYDYSEAFDGSTNTADTVNASDGPYAPVPTRAGYSNRPSVLEEDYVTRFEAHRSASAFELRPMSSPALSSRKSTSEWYSDTNDAQPTYKGRRSKEDRAHSLTSEALVTTKGSLDFITHFPEQAAAHRLAQQQHASQHPPDGMGDDASRGHPVPPLVSRARAQTSSMSPKRGSYEESDVLDELGNAVQHTNQKDDTANTEIIGRPANERLPLTQSRPLLIHKHNGRVALRLQIPEQGKRSPSGKGPSGMENVETGPMTTDAIEAHVSNTTIHEPQPISPVRELKLRNSITHLMKALPPLPGSEENRAGPTSIRVSNDDQYAVQFSPFSLKRLSTPPGVRRVDDTGRMSASYGSPEQLARRLVSCSDSDLSFGTSYQLPSWSGSPLVGSEEASLISPRRRAQTGTQFGPLRKLKFTRPALAEAFVALPEMAPTELGATSQRISDWKQSAPRPRQVGIHFASQNAVTAPSTDQVAYGDSGLMSKDTENTSELGCDRSAKPLIEAQSFFSDNSVEEPVRGLRKRLSNLKLRLAEPRSNRVIVTHLAAAHLMDDRGHRIGLAQEKKSIVLEPIPEPVASKTLLEAEKYSVQEYGFRQKMSRWMKSAKHAFTTLGRRKESPD